MKPATVLLFDVDSTLTPPRQPIRREMVDILSALICPFGVAAGSHMPLLLPQFFDPLYELGFRGQFDAFVSNGAIQYRADYAREPKLNLVDEFDIRRHLGEEDYAFLVRNLAEVLDMPEFRLPSGLADNPDRIAFRGSMVNCSPIGRPLIEGEQAQRNRARFVQLDHEEQYRSRMGDLLRARLAPLMGQRQLTIALGGQTSFDIGVEGQDKAKAVKVLLGSGFERVVFFGDALFEGGNDAPIQHLANRIPSQVEAVAVESWQDTVDQLKKREVVRTEIL
jgi:phosphomannomutase